MADTETTKQATDWLTLEELSARWGRSIERILGYEAHGRLRIAARTSFYMERTVTRRALTWKKDGLSDTSTEEVTGKFENAQALYYPPQGDASLLEREDAVVEVRGLTDKDLFGLTSHKLKKDAPFELGTINMRREALRVSIEEVQRFEREHINKPTNIPFVVQQTPQPAAPSQEAVPEKKAFTAPHGNKAQKQEAAVLHWIEHNGWNPQAVPDGEKGNIEALCEGNEETKRLFTAPTAFDETWRRLRSNERVRMESHDSYAHRGK